MNTESGLCDHHQDERKGYMSVTLPDGVRMIHKRQDVEPNHNIGKHLPTRTKFVESQAHGDNDCLWLALITLLLHVTPVEGTASDVLT